MPANLVAEKLSFAVSDDLADVILGEEKVLGDLAVGLSPVEIGEPGEVRAPAAPDVIRFGRPVVHPPGGGLGL